jgi:molybdenum cofactor biosynthesis enzyme
MDSRVLKVVDFVEALTAAQVTLLTIYDMCNFNDSKFSASLLEQVSLLSLKLDF